MLGEVFERFVEKSPLSVMVRASLSASWVLIGSTCGMSALRRSNIPEISCFPASMI